MLARRWAWTIEVHGLQIISVKNFQIFNFVFVNDKCTSNMAAACYYYV